MALGFLGALAVAALIVLGVFWIAQNVEIKKRKD